MISRLEVANAELAKKICAAPFTDGQSMVAENIKENLTRMPSEATELLPDIKEISKYRVSSKQIEALDNLYFNLEEQGDIEGSNAAFIAARFIAAVKAYQEASNQFELCEAAYEAKFTIK